MRLDSSSMRRIAVAVSAGSRAAPMRNSSAYPRIAAQRGAQLVRGVGEELAQAIFAGLALREGLLETVEHRVQRQPQAAHLGAWRGRLDAPREIAGGDRARGARHPIERAQADPHDEEGGYAERQQGPGHDEDLDEQQATERLVDVALAVQPRR